MKKEDVLRSCLGCREVYKKKSLLRLVLSPEKEVVLDYFSKLPGRGAYVCPDMTCFEKAFNGNAFKKAFKGNVLLPSLDEVLKIFKLKCSEKIASLLSMAIRSRKVSIGTEAVEGEFKKGTVSLLLLSKDLSQSARSHWNGKSASKNIGIKTIPSSEAIDGLLRGRKIVALKDSGMAEIIKSEIEKLEKMGVDSI